MRLSYHALSAAAWLATLPASDQRNNFAINIALLSAGAQAARLAVSFVLAAQPSFASALQTSCTAHARAHTFRSLQWPLARCAAMQHPIRGTGLAPRLHAVAQPALVHSLGMRLREPPAHKDLIAARLVADKCGALYITHCSAARCISKHYTAVLALRSTPGRVRTATVA